MSLGLGLHVHIDGIRPMPMGSGPRPCSRRLFQTGGSSPPGADQRLCELRARGGHERGHPPDRVTRIHWPRGTRRTFGCGSRGCWRFRQYDGGSIGRRGIEARSVCRRTEGTGVELTYEPRSVFARHVQPVQNQCRLGWNCAAATRGGARDESNQRTCDESALNFAG
jgi:hypothetical protein